MSAAAFCLFVRKTDRQNSEWFHIVYSTTRLVCYRNPHISPILSVCLSVCLSVRKTRITVLYMFSDFTTA